MRKSQADRFSSVEAKRNVTIIKCFICNQIFYSQNPFDAHMKQHSHKLSRTKPDEIQRKTLESFRVKKNSQLKDPAASKIKNMEQGNRTCELESEKNHSQSVEQLALKESIVLVEKLELLTKQQQLIEGVDLYQNPSELITELEVERSVSEAEFAKLIFTGSKPSYQQIKRTLFLNEVCQSYQEQLEYLNQVMEIEEDICRGKIEEIRAKILAALTEEIKSREVSVKTKNEKNQKWIQRVKNTEVSYCSECCQIINCNEECFFLGCGHKYHEECWEQGNNCCG